MRVAGQLTFVFKKVRGNKKKQLTCGDCARHDRFWKCTVNGKTMNPCYCVGCSFFKPKIKMKV